MYAINEIKKKLRRELIGVRRRIVKSEITAKSECIFKYFCDWEYYQQAQTVMLYLSMVDEPQMEKIIKNTWLSGKTVCVPYMRETYGIMDAVIIHSMDDLTQGRFNLLVPKNNNEVVHPGDIDVIVVPAVGYDFHGNRLGMGAGYYDRYLKKAINAIRIGAVWSCNIVDNIPTDKHDEAVEYLLTEVGITKCNST